MKLNKSYQAGAGYAVDWLANALRAVSFGVWKMAVNFAFRFYF
jgi:hypothetical protein